jgi:hypothetical protein
MYILGEIICIGGEIENTRNLVTAESYRNDVGESCDCESPKRTEAVRCLFSTYPTIYILWMYHHFLA